MEKVAFLGLGTMGAAMAANLARAGFAVTAWNRTPDRAPELDDLGVSRAVSPAAAVGDTPIVVICVSDTPDVERARPVLGALGRTITHVGPIGAGQAVKAVNQVILAGTYIGVAEGIVLATKAGLDVEQVVGALGGGAAQSWVLANRSGRMIDNDYPLGFKVALHHKDLAIALSLAAQLGAVLPVAALVAQLEAGLMATGHADEDMSAVARSIRGLSGLDD